MYFGFRASKKLMDQLKDIAERESQPVSAIIRMAINEFLKKHQ